MGKRKLSFRLLLLFRYLVASEAFLPTANVSKAAIATVPRSVHLILICPGLSLRLVPVLGRNKEFQADPSNIVLIHMARLDSIISTPRMNNNREHSERKAFYSNKKVHILCLSPDMWGHWSPKKAIDAAKQHKCWSTG